MSVSFVSSLYTAILLGVVAGQQFVDDACTIQSTGVAGVCKLLIDCQNARKELLENKFPQTCGFQGTKPIVCCPRTQTVTPETTTTTEYTPPGRKPGDISRRKCREYSAYVYETIVPPIAVINPEVVRRNECGHKVVQLIVGGELATRKEFPHMAAIGYKPNTGDVQWLCGGTILSKMFVLTAAHCLSDLNWGDALWVRLGVSTLTDSGHRQQIKISQRIPHPEYRSNSHYHDIGLLKLESKAKLNSFARPACLYMKPEISAQKAIATGWGQTSWGGDTSNNLLKVTIDIFNHSICDSSYQNERRLQNGILDDLQVCAGSMSIDEEKDTCKGDSGGPLQIYHIGDEIKCMYDIIGVTSFGKGCSGSPGVYVRVSNYIKWIEDTVWA